MKFQDKLKELRNQKGISQYKLAKDLNISRSVVAKWETGLVVPSDESLKLLCNYFNISEEELNSTSQIKDGNYELCSNKNKKNKLSRVFTIISILLIHMFLVMIADICINGYYNEKHNFKTIDWKNEFYNTTPVLILIIICFLVAFLTRKKRKNKIDNIVSNSNTVNSIKIEKICTIALVTSLISLFALFLPFFAKTTQDMHNYLSILIGQKFNLFQFLFKFEPVTLVMDFENNRVSYVILIGLLWMLSITVILAVLYLIISLFIKKFKDEKYLKYRLMITKIITLVLMILFVLVYIATYLFRIDYQYTWGGEGLYFYVTPYSGMYIGLISSIVGFYKCWFLKVKDKNL